MHWQHFRQLNEIKNLTIDQQVKMYNEFLNNLFYTEYPAWLNRGGGGGQPVGTIGPVLEGFLQQEDLNYILQEDNSKIYITE
jgi:hypothetical protein